MLHKTHQTGSDMDMFRNELVNIINMKHKLVTPVMLFFNKKPCKKLA